MEQKRDFSTEVTAEVGPRADFFVFMTGETSGQLEQLRIVGCDQAQGYYFAKPLGSEQVATLLEIGSLGP